MKTRLDLGMGMGTLGLVFGAALLLFGPSRALAAACVGDCDGSGRVTIDKLIKGVNIALGSANVDQCPAFDINDSGTVTIDELIKGVNNALTGCPVSALLARRVTTAPAGIDDPVWAQITAYSPELSTMNAGYLYGDGQLNMSGTFEGLESFNGGNPANLALRAVHDGTNLYVLAEWNDATFNLDRRRWLFNGATDPLKPGESANGWTSQLNDDKIAFAFEIESASSEFGSFADVGCASSCHNVGAELDMRPAAGRVDIWHWKTSRSEPLGYVDDQVSSPEPGRVDDGGTSIEHRNRPDAGDNRSGPAVEWDGTSQTFERWDGVVVTLDPAYILLDGHQIPFTGDAGTGQTTYGASCAGCHGARGQGGFGPPLTTVKLARMARTGLDQFIADAGRHPGAMMYSGLAAEQKTNLLARLRGFSGVPGYILTAPQGSVGDVATQSNVDYTQVDDTMRTRYRVLMVRKLDTGNADDAAFAPGQSYPFGVALMDNDGRNHIGSPRETLSLLP